jgi:hypothetical protein
VASQLVVIEGLSGGFNREFESVGAG